MVLPQAEVFSSEAGTAWCQENTSNQETVKSKIWNPVLILIETEKASAARIFCVVTLPNPTAFMNTAARRDKIVRRGILLQSFAGRGECHGQDRFVVENEAACGLAGCSMPAG
jgi:hypothetical protein